MTPFDALAQDLDELAGAPQRAAAAAAPRVAAAVRERFAGGQLRGLTATATARADGAAIVLELDPRLPLEVLHLEALPDDLGAPIEAALTEEGPR
jgi:hypothetical protein